MSWDPRFYYVYDRATAEWVPKADAVPDGGREGEQ
jgi:hypothetical protein